MSRLDQSKLVFAKIVSNLVHNSSPKSESELGLMHTWKTLKIYLNVESARKTKIVTDPLILTLISQVQTCDRFLSCFVHELSES